MPGDTTKRRDICLDVFGLDYVLASHLTFHFQSVAPKYQKRETNRFLAGMESLRLVRRFPLPAARGNRGGSAPKVVALDEVGAQMVAEELGIFVTKTRWKAAKREKNFWFLNHTLEIADFFYTVRYAAQAMNYDVEWVGEAEIKRSSPITVTIAVETPVGQDESPVTDKKLRLIPDGVFTIATADETRRSHQLFELDRGTVTINSQSPLQRQAINQKIAGYQEFMAKGLYKSVFNMKSPPRITWLTTSQKRLESIKQAIEETVSDKWRHSHWLTTKSQATPETVLTKPIWTVAGREGTYVLFKDGTTAGSSA